MKWIIATLIILTMLIVPVTAINETDAIGQYYFEEGTGTNSDDGAAADNDATLAAGASWDSTNVSTGQSWSVMLDGDADAYITIPHSTANSFQENDFTIMMRFHTHKDFDVLETNNRLLMGKKANNWDVDGWNFNINHYSYAGLILEVADGVEREMTYADDNEWVTDTMYTASVAYDATAESAVYYIDTTGLNGGTYTGATTTTPLLDAGDDIVIGGGLNGLSNAYMSVDWVLLFDSELTAQEISDVIDSMDAGVAGPVISNTVPTQETSSYEHDAKTFSLDIDQTATVTWYLDTVLKETDTDVTSASYIDSTAAIGTARNVTAIATNVNGSDSYEWDWDVLENTVDVEVTYYNPDNLSYNIIWEITNATAGLQSINVSYNDTASGNTYKGYIDLATDELLNTLVASGDGDTLWCNTTNVSDNIFFVAETGAVETTFEYWDGAWADDEAEYYLYHDYVWWWHNLHPNYLQTASQPTLKITNSGSGAGIPYMWLDDEPPATVELWVDNDNIKNGDSIELGWGEANKTAVHTELAAGENVTLWHWGVFLGYDGDFIFNVTAEVQ